MVINNYCYVWYIFYFIGLPNTQTKVEFGYEKKKGKEKCAGLKQLIQEYKFCLWMQAKLRDGAQPQRIIVS